MGCAQDAPAASISKWERHFWAAVAAVVGLTVAGTVSQLWGVWVDQYPVFFWCSGAPVADVLGVIFSAVLHPPRHRARTALLAAGAAGFMPGLLRAMPLME